MRAIDAATHTDRHPDDGGTDNGGTDNRDADNRDAYRCNSQPQCHADTDTHLHSAQPDPGDNSAEVQRRGIPVQQVPWHAGPHAHHQTIANDRTGHRGGNLNGHRHANQHFTSIACQADQRLLRRGDAHTGKQ